MSLCSISACQYWSHLAELLVLYSLPPANLLPENDNRAALWTLVSRPERQARVVRPRPWCIYANVGIIPL